MKKLMFLLLSLSVIIVGCTVTPNSNAITTPEAKTSPVVIFENNHTPAPIRKQNLLINGVESLIPFEVAEESNEIRISLIDFLKLSKSAFILVSDAVNITIGRDIVQIKPEEYYINLNNEYKPIISKMVKENDIYFVDEKLIKQLFGLEVGQLNGDYNIVFMNEFAIDYKMIKPTEPSDETLEIYDQIIIGYDFINTLEPLESILNENPHDIKAMKLLAEDYQMHAKLDAAFEHKEESERKRLLAAKLYEISMNYDYEDTVVGSREDISNWVKSLRDFNQSIVPADRVRILILYGKPDREITTETDGDKYITYFYNEDGRMYEFKNSKMISETELK